MEHTIIERIQHPVTLTEEGIVQTNFFRYLDTVGDGTGTKNANGDYSVATGSGAERFIIKPAAGEIMRVHRMVITIEDTAGFLAAEYGNLGTILTNGIDLKFVRNAVDIKSYMDNLPVKSNAGWGSVCYDVDLKTWGAGNEFLLVRWTFLAAGAPIRLIGDNVESLEIVITDENLTGLVSHYFMVQGVYE